MDNSFFAGRYSDPLFDTLPAWPLSDGEIHFLYWFIQGSITIPETRRALRRGWGFCERHAWAALAVELCYRPKFLHGPALLYRELLQRCLAAIPERGPLRGQRLARRWCSQGRCRMCELNTYRAGRGGGLPSVIDRGRQTGPLYRFAVAHKDHWNSTVCGLCRGDNSPMRCRRHLIAQPGGTADDEIARHAAMLGEMLDRMRMLARSYEWGHHGTDRPQDRGALISAVGFMSGWRPLLALLDAHATT